MPDEDKSKDELLVEINQLRREVDTLKNKVARYRAYEAENEMLAAVVENNREFMGLASMEGKVFYLNPAGREMVGLDVSMDVSKTRITDYVSGENDYILRDIVLPEIMKNGVCKSRGGLTHFITGESIPVESTTFIIKSR